MSSFSNTDSWINAPHISTLSPSHSPPLFLFASISISLAIFFTKLYSLLSSILDTWLDCRSKRPFCHWTDSYRLLKIGSYCCSRPNALPKIASLTFGIVNVETSITICLAFQLSTEQSWHFITKRFWPFRAFDNNFDFPMQIDRQ